LFERQAERRSPASEIRQRYRDCVLNEAGDAVELALPDKCANRSWSKVDMSKHYKIARGEAMECAASLDVRKVRHLIEQPRYERGIELLEAVVAMLTKMITVESST
jgi:four helix bundle protein